MIRRFFREIFLRTDEYHIRQCDQSDPADLYQAQDNRFSNGLHWTAITTVESPVTHTLVAAVKTASGKVTACPGALQNGIHKISPPTKITPAKPRAIICDVFSLCNPSETFFKFINIFIFCNYEKENCRPPTCRNLHSSALQEPH